MSLIKIQLFLVLNLLATSTFASPDHPYDFYDLSTKVNFLFHLRADFPSLYQEFMVRNDPIMFFDRAQKIIDELGYSSAKPLDAKKMILYSEASVFSYQEAEATALLQELKQEPYASLKEKSLLRALTESIKKRSYLEGLRAGLAQSKSIQNAVELLRLPDGELLQALSRLVLGQEKVDGINPRRFGIDQDAFSGKEVLELFQAALEAQEKAPKLLWLSMLKLQGTVAHFYDRFFDNEYQKNLEQIFSEINQLEPGVLKQKYFNEFGKGALKTLKARLKVTEMPKEAKPILTLERAHPFDSWLRGKLGNCATEIGFAASLLSGEEDYWISTQDSEGKSRLRGYFSMTRVKVKGESALYVHTHVGVHLSPEQVMTSFEMLANSLEYYHATKIILPLQVQASNNLNQAEIKAIYQKLEEGGKVVPLEYGDQVEREKLITSLATNDLPSNNLQGIEINLNQFKSLPDLKFVSHPKETKALFPHPSDKELFLISLELKNRGTSDQILEEVLGLKGLDHASFDHFWSVLQNKDRLMIAPFHHRIQEEMARNKLPVTWDEFKELPLLFSGNFAAPDALEGENIKLSMIYIQTYLLAMTGSESVYQTLAPLFVKLSMTAPFVNLVRYLFRKNYNELGRNLDYYDLEYRSVYRTLTKLFLNGLPVTPFLAEVEALGQPVENLEKYAGIESRVFLRRKTLLGVMDPRPETHFNDVMNFLERGSKKNLILSYEDKRVVSSYFSFVLGRNQEPDAQSERISAFLLGSELGLSLAENLGCYPLKRLKVEAIIGALVAKGKYLWLAHLIHQDPWPAHPQAAEWFKVLMDHRQSFPPNLILQGISTNANWLKIPGVAKSLDELIGDIHQDPGAEALMVKVLLTLPFPLSVHQKAWLSQISNENIAKFILEKTSDRAITAALTSRFPHLIKNGECQNLLKAHAVLSEVGP